MNGSLDIEIFFRPNKKETFGLPEKVTVEKGTKINWVIKKKRVYTSLIFSNPIFSRGVKFTLYFEDKSPFKWVKESIIIIDRTPRDNWKNMPILIASGTAESDGEFKYGLKLMSIGNTEVPTYDEEPVYDDDPFIVVKE